MTVNAAAGNHYTAGYGNTSGKNLPFASDPDSSTQCEPATYSSVVSVASVDNSLAHSAFTVGDRDIPSSGPVALTVRRCPTCPT